jgi:hypothetical protein
VNPPLDRIVASPLATGALTALSAITTILLATLQH